MSAEAKLKEAIVAELRRQAANKGGDLTVEPEGDNHVQVDGRINLDELTMVVLGSLAGGP